MKYMVIIAVLLHICKAHARAMDFNKADDEAMKHRNAIQEIIHQLEKIKNQSLNLGQAVQVPTNKMREDACNCSGTFAKDLKHLVNALQKTHLGRDLLQHLTKAVKTLSEHHQLEKKVCKSIKKVKLTKSMIPEYILFLQEMNEKDCSIVPARIWRDTQHK